MGTLQAALRSAERTRRTDPRTLALELGRYEAGRQQYTGALSDGELLVFGKRCERAYQKRQPVPDLKEFIRSWREPAPPHPIGTGHWPLVVVQPRPRPAEVSPVIPVPEPPRLLAPAPPALDPIPLYPILAPRTSPARRILRGAAWRIAITLLVLVCAAAGVALPVLGVAAVIAAGVLTGLWYRSWRIARVWRWLIGAGLVAYVLPLVLAPLAGRAIALTLVLAVAAPAVIALRNLDG